MMCNKMKRLGIFIFYDRDSIVDDYVIFLLEEFVKSLDKLVILSNSKLDIENKNKLLKFTDCYIERENYGLDAGALYDYFNGTDEYLEYDEVVCINDTFYGPFYSFDEIYEKMNKKKIDFWGLTLGHIQRDGYQIFDEGYIPEHIQTFFIAFRKNVLNSECFKKYWKEYPIENRLTFYDVVTGHELIFTKYLKEHGFKYDSYIVDSDVSDDYNRNYNNFSYNASQQIIIDGAPFIKRKNFSFNEADFLYLSDNNDLKKAVNYIKKYTNYDIGLIWKNVLRQYNLNQVKNVYGFDVVIKESNKETNLETTFILKVDNEFIVEKVCNIINSFGCSYFIFSKSKKIIKMFKSKKINAILIKDSFQKEFVSVVKEINTNTIMFANLKDRDDTINLIFKSINDVYLNNLLKNPNYFNNVLSLLEDKNVSMIYSPESINYDLFRSKMFWDYELFENVKSVVPNYNVLDCNQLPVSYSECWVAKKNVIENSLLDNWKLMDDDMFCSVLSIALSYTGTFFAQYPLIANDEDYMLYKFSMQKAIIEKTYRQIYLNNDYYPFTICESIKSISNQREQRRFKYALRKAIRDRVPAWFYNFFKRIYDVFRKD